jgi:phosphohistidine phosphatase
MPRTLHLLRHAKSSWDDPAATDHERPLAARGRRAAATMAGHLRDERISPALVLCSSAVRARQTLARVSAGFDPGCDLRIEIEGGLYEASAAALLARIGRVAGDVGSLMLIGHEPAIGELSQDLAGPGGDEAQLKRLREKFPTAALATFDCPGVWSDLHPGAARLVAFVKPRELA